MAAGFSLKDQLFNPQSIGQLAQEFAQALPSFDADAFSTRVLSGFEDRELMARLEWIADCLEAQLSPDFEEMAEQLEAAMPDPLDPTLRDDDFGQFIHAAPGILAVRHGLEKHRARATALLYAATKRFSMEFYIRPFLNRWPEHTLAQLHRWAEDENYHVRRLVSEGTRPKLPWAKAVDLTSDQTLPLLDKLQADPTRFVTRSVANHLNDLSKTEPDRVLKRLEEWQAIGKQGQKELTWMRRHGLRTLIKSGNTGAMAALGYKADAPLRARVVIENAELPIGDTLKFNATLVSETQTPVLVDYRIVFTRPNGRTGQKVFKLKQGVVGPAKPLHLSKSHRIKLDATTFKWYPGLHRLILQVNGVDRADAVFSIL